MKTAPLACPQCGGEIQATQVVEIYLTLKESGWEPIDKNTTQVRYYCANDHQFALIEAGKPEYFIPPVPKEML